LNGRTGPEKYAADGRKYYADCEEEGEDGFRGEDRLPRLETLLSERIVCSLPSALSALCLVALVTYLAVCGTWFSPWVLHDCWSHRSALVFATFWFMLLGVVDVAAKMRVVSRRRWALPWSRELRESARAGGNYFKGPLFGLLG
jgi:hypothetical protein